MSKYCKPMGLYVTYLDCMDCEDKECIQLHKKKESDKVSYLANIKCEPNDTIYLVFCSKRENAKKNIVFKCNVEMVSITAEGIRYYCHALKCVTDKETNKKLEEGNCVNGYRFGSQNIDTGCRNTGRDLYPVFTTKERCIEWLKG